MYQLRPNINLRQIASAAAIAIIASFAIYYVFDVMPRHFEDKKFVSDEMSEGEVKARIKEIIEEHGWDRFNSRDVQINQWSIIIEKVDDDACEKGLSFFSRTAKIDLRTMVTRGDRVEQRVREPFEHRRFGMMPRRGVIKWRFDRSYTQQAGKYEKELRDLLESERRRIGWGEAAAHEATSIFLARYDDRVLWNSEAVQYCSGKRSLSILDTDFRLSFILPLGSNVTQELMELMHFYKTGITRKEWESR
jgi:hypothetical protein